MPPSSPGGGLSEERLEILRLVENQTISADEAARILEALDRADRQPQPQQPTAPFPPPTPPSPRHRGKVRPASVRIRITDLGNSTAKVNLVLPYRLVDAGVKMVKRLAPDQMSVLDGREIRRSMDQGFWGPLVDITDDKQRIEIIVEGGNPASGDDLVDEATTRKIS